MRFTTLIKKTLEIVKPELTTDMVVGAGSSWNGGKLRKRGNEPGITMWFGNEPVSVIYDASKKYSKAQGYHVQIQTPLSLAAHIEDAVNKGFKQVWVHSITK